MVLTSTVAERVGHTTQICVMPGYQGHSIGRQLMEAFDRGAAAPELRVAVADRYGGQQARRASSTSIWDFSTIKTFAAGVWQA